jgi:hypothetical protein
VSLPVSLQLWLEDDSTFEARNISAKVPQPQTPPRTNQFLVSRMFLQCWRCELEIIKRFGNRSHSGCIHTCTITTSALRYAIATRLLGSLRRPIEYVRNVTLALPADLVQYESVMLLADGLICGSACGVHNPQKI